MPQSKSVSFKALKKLPVQKRVEAAKRQDIGHSLLDALTPTEYASLFPKHYLQGLPDVGGFRDAITKRTQEARAKADADVARRLADVEKGDGLIGKIKRYFKGKDEVIPSLTPEQQAAFERLKKGAIPVDSDDAKIFANLTKEQLASIGVDRVKDEKGNEVFKYNTPEVSRAEAEGRLKTGGDSKGGSLTQNQGVAYQAAISEGLSPDAAKALVANMSGEALHKPWDVHPDPSRRNPNQMAHGIVQWDDERAAKIKNQFGKWPQEMSVAEQTKAAIWELKKDFPGVWNRLNDPNISSSEKVRTLVYDYEKPGDKEGAYSYRAGLLGKINTQGEAEKPKGPNNTYTDEQIDNMMEKLRKEKDETRKTQLARLLQDSGAPVSVSSGGDVKFLGEPVGKGVTGTVIGGQIGDSQCVALSKHFSGLGAASGWNVSYNPSGIVPGAVIATTNYGNGNGGVMAKDTPDGKSHYHTGIALTRPDSAGNVLILDQAVGKPVSITRININDYNGEKWGPVAGGGPTDRSMQAVNMALEKAGPSEREAIMSSLRGGTPSTESMSSSKTIKPVVENHAVATNRPTDQEGRRLQADEQARQRVSRAERPTVEKTERPQKTEKKPEVEKSDRKVAKVEHRDISRNTDQSHDRKQVAHNTEAKSAERNVERKQVAAPKGNETDIKPKSKPVEMASHPMPKSEHESKPQPQAEERKVAEKNDKPIERQQNRDEGLIHDALAMNKGGYHSPSFERAIKSSQITDDHYSAVGKSNKFS